MPSPDNSSSRKPMGLVLEILLILLPATVIAVPVLFFGLLLLGHWQGGLAVGCTLGLVGLWRTMLGNRESINTIFVAIGFVICAVITAGILWRAFSSLANGASLQSNLHLVFFPWALGLLWLGWKYNLGPWVKLLRTKSRQ